MVPLNFFRDKTHVYVNNPDGTTKKMSIADFEAMLNGSGGGSGSGSVLVVKTLYDEGGTSHLDKTYDVICEAIADGKLVITYRSVEVDGTYYFAQTGLISNAGIDEDTEDKFVETLKYSFGTIVLDRYIESNGMLTLNKNYRVVIPTLVPTCQAFTILSNTLYGSGADVYDALASKYCYFVNGSAGTNNNQRFTATEYGKTGSTYYVVLSNGDRYEGGSTGNMTKVTVNP